MSRRVRLAVLVAGVAVLAQPGLAEAGTVTLSGDVLSYDAAPGEANRVTIVATPDAGGLSLRVIDTTAPVTAGAGCASVNANEATCADPTPTTGLDSLLVDAGDMADFVQVSTGWYAESIVNGGDGADELVGGYGRRNLLNGDGDADQLVGYDSPFVPVRTFLDGGSGPDVFLTGGSRDVVDYSSRTNPVTVTVGDGLANDGEVGEGDRVGPQLGVRGGDGADDISNPGGGRLDAGGGAGSDTLTALGRGGDLKGGPGDDVLVDMVGSKHGFVGMDGGTGNDELIGGAGFDQASGKDGADTIFGGERRDALFGGPGDDRITGGPGRDLLRGNAGDDTLYARDGLRDYGSGGSGFDRARIDQGLDALHNIEELF